MPKMKTHRGAAKRFSVTGTGKIKRSRANTSHILTPKTTKRKRNLRKSVIVDRTNEKSLRKLIPYLNPVAG
ncbi:MAG: 50S ribosomal protein L35 [Deltaproteobacteria bacterium]|jgi:large subunit ribosomal protein L35|nr:50S ribosomal protein L35 [Deltaproteobacteria bacterium]